MPGLRTFLFAFVVGGCSTDGRTMNEEVEPDASEEEPLPTPDPTPSPSPSPGGPSIRVTVTDGSVPQAGVTVVFQNPDDSVVADVITDSAGTASAELATGTVSVLRTGPGGTQVFTYVGAKAGDRLRLGRPTSPGGAPVAVEIKLPIGLDNVQMRTPCGSAAGAFPTMPLTLSGCASETVFYGADEAQQNYMVWVGAPSSALDFRLSEVRKRLGSTLTAFNQPTDATTTVEGRLELQRFRMYTTGARAVPVPQFLSYPDLEGAQQITVATVSRPDATQLLAARRWQPALVAFDIGATLLPYVTAPTLDATSFRWVEAGSGTPDFIVASMTVTPVGGTPYVRAIAAPYTAGTLRIPRLAGAHAPLDIKAGDQLTGIPGIAKVTGGYDAIRNELFHGETVIDTAPIFSNVVLSFPGQQPPSI
jgi:hypothetical protein